MDELYDLRADPYELNNLVRDPMSQALLRELKTDLRGLLKKVPEKSP